MPDHPDYDTLTDPEINRLCVERIWPKMQMTPPNYCRDRNALPELLKALTDPSVIFNFSVCLMAAEKRMGWLSVSRHLVALFALQADPKNVAIAFLKATEPGT